MGIRPRLGKNIDSIGDPISSLDWAAITGDPTDNTDLVTYLDATYLKVDGSNEMEADLDMSGNDINGVAIIRDSTDTPFLDCDNRLITNSSNNVIINVLAQTLNNPGGPVKVNWDTGLLKDNVDEIKINWLSSLLSGAWTANNDFKIENTTKGLVIYDRTLAAYYRIYLANGLLLIEAV